MGLIYVKKCDINKLNSIAKEDRMNKRSVLKNAKDIKHFIAQNNLVFKSVCEKTVSHLEHVLLRVIEEFQYEMPVPYVSLLEDNGLLLQWVFQHYDENDESLTQWYAAVEFCKERDLYSSYAYEILCEQEDVWADLNEDALGLVGHAMLNFTPSGEGLCHTNLDFDDPCLVESFVDFLQFFYPEVQGPLEV